MNDLNNTDMKTQLNFNNRLTFDINDTFSPEEIAWVTDLWLAAPTGSELKLALECLYASMLVQGQLEVFEDNLPEDVATKLCKLATFAFEVTVGHDGTEPFVYDYETTGYILDVSHSEYEGRNALTNEVQEYNARRGRKTFIISYGRDCDGIDCTRVYEFCSERQASLMANAWSEAGDGEGYRTTTKQEADEYRAQVG